MLTVYVGDDGLIRRNDYDVETMANSEGDHYVSTYTESRRPNNKGSISMAKYVFIYTGATKGASQEDWTSWFEGLGDRVAEAGYPFFGASATVNFSGVTGGGASSAGGYTIVNADSIDEATTVAKGCPIVASGGNVEVYEASEM